MSPNRGHRTEAHATPYCSPASSANAKIPSASATSLLSSTVARVDPSATVTTRSNAFSFASVRLPKARNSTTSAP